MSRSGEALRLATFMPDQYDGIAYPEGFFGLVYANMEARCAEEGMEVVWLPDRKAPHPDYRRDVANFYAQRRAILETVGGLALITRYYTYPVRFSAGDLTNIEIATDLGLPIFSNGPVQNRVEFPATNVRGDARAAQIIREADIIITETPEDMYFQLAIPRNEEN